MPVSWTANLIVSSGPGDTRSDTVPRSVNLIAFDSRFFSTWPSRCASLVIVGGNPASTTEPNARPFCSAQRLEGLVERIDGGRQRDRLHRQLDLAGFDLRQVEDVVDQREQVVAGVVDGARELHLFLGEVAVAIVGEQRGEDQRRVERRAQLVAHVGQELALVMIGALELGGLVGQHHLGLRQVGALRLEQVGLFFEMRVDLFELGLLLLEPALRLPEHAALFLELLVADAQLLLLGLQLLGLLLRFREQLFQP